MFDGSIPNLTLGLVEYSRLNEQILSNNLVIFLLQSNLESHCYESHQATIAFSEGRKSYLRMKRRRHDSSIESDDNSGNHDIECHNATSKPNPPVQEQLKPQQIKEMQEQYHKLTQIEIMLRKEYQKLVQEEHQLRLALQQSKESGRERMMREKKEKEEDALHRLEAALMMDDGDEEDSSGSDDDDNEDNNFAAIKGKNELSRVLESEEESSDDDEMDEEKILEML